MDLMWKQQFKNHNFSFETNEHITIIINRLHDLQWFFVGGIVRDSLLGIKTYDVDITTTADPAVIIDRMKNLNVITIGQRFGTIGVFIGPWKVEITTTRQDINPDGRHTDVKFQVSFEEDCARRDFTFNSLLYKNNEIIDYNNGLFDLMNNQIKFIGDPNKRIQEDYLRLIRYIRFYVRYGYNTMIDDHITSLFTNNLHGLKQISMERIINELYSMCNYNNTNQSIDLFNKNGISNYIFGENLCNYIYDFQDPITKLSIIFKSYKNYNRLSLPKMTKQLIDIYNINKGDYLDNIVYLWYKHKSWEIAKTYIKFLQQYKNINDYNKLLNINWSINNESIQSIIGPERSIAELNLRKSYLMKNLSKNDLII